MTESSVTLSLCMIVKDEEAVLSRCLNSVRDIVDEIIIVDTGSADATKEIAKSLGARVFDYPWDDDFSSARNFSLDRATGAWILVLDADEFLAPGSKEEFIKLLQDDGAEGYFIRIVSLLGESSDFETCEDMVVRLFRNRPEYRFRGAIHEQVRPAIAGLAGENALKKAPAAICHDGYLSAVIHKKGKVRRNSGVIKKALDANPANPFLLYSLGCEHLITDDFQGALDLFGSALAGIPAGEGYLPDLVMKTGLCLYKLGKVSEMCGLITCYKESAPLSPVLFYLSGLANFDAGKLAEAEQDMHACLARGPICAPHHPGITEHQIYQVLGEIQEAKGAWAAAVKFYFRAVKAKPNYLYPLKRLTGIYKRTVKFPDIDGFLDFCSTDARGVLLSKLDWEHEADIVIYLLLGLTRDAVISGSSVPQDIFPACSRHLRVAAAALLTKAVLALAGDKFPEAGGLTGICEEIRQNIKELMFCKEVW